MVRSIPVNCLVYSKVAVTIPRKCIPTCWNTSFSEMKHDTVAVMAPVTQYLPHVVNCFIGGNIHSNQRDAMVYVKMIVL